MRGKLMEKRIIVVGSNVSLKPYIKKAKASENFESQLAKMVFEIKEEPPKRKIGFLATSDR